MQKLVTLEAEAKLEVLRKKIKSLGSLLVAFQAGLTARFSLRQLMTRSAKNHLLLQRAQKPIRLMNRRKPKNWHHNSTCDTNSFLLQSLEYRGFQKIHRNAVIIARKSSSKLCWISPRQKVWNILPTAQLLMILRISDLAAARQKSLEFCLQCVMWG